MRRLLLILPLVLLTGCGLTDPTVEPSTPPPAKSAAAKPQELQPALASHVASRPASSPSAAAKAFTNLALNFSINNTPAALTRAISLATYSEARRIDGFYEQTVADRNKTNKLPQGDVLTTTPAPDGPAGFVYVIARQGDYTPEGAPAGPSNVVVYAVRTTRRNGGYVVSSWEPAR